MKNIDACLPSKRTLHLRGEILRHQTYLFTQLRTGHAWVNAKLRKLYEDDKCECGAKETFLDILVNCPLLREQRKQLRKKIGDSFSSMTRMLGGWERNGQGKITQWPIDRTVLNAVIEFAEVSQRF